MQARTFFPAFLNAFIIAIVTAVFPLPLADAAITIPGIPDDCDLLFLYAPTSDITDDEKTIIEKYLSDGGKVYLILGDTTSDTPNLDGIMSDYGLKKVSGYIADTQRCYQGNYYAIFPQLSLSGDLGSGISNQMVLLLNSPGMEKTDTDNDNLTVTPFMQTSDSGYAVTENDQTQGQYILGAVSTNAISADSSDSDSEDEDDRVMQRIQTQRQQDLRCLLLHL